MCGKRWNVLKFGSALIVGFKDILDILCVAVLLYEAYRLLRKSVAVNLFWGILAFLVVWFIVTFVIQLDLTGAIFERVISVGAIAIIVIFQEEIRAFFYKLGSRFSDWRVRRSHTDGKEAAEQYVQQVVLACRHMSKSKTGALIVLAGKQDLKEWMDTGELLDAAISARLIENIFFKNTPLHDGALIIRNGRIVSAACILPVSKKQDIPQHYGLRHRAALGLTELTDAVAIVVSEETGRISVAKGDAIRYVNEETLIQTVIA